jgi:hypothetical protein
VEDDRHRCLRDADLVVEELLGPGGLEVPADEAAGPERIARLDGKRDRTRQENRPGGDDPPASTGGPPAEAFEGAQGRGTDIAGAS